VELEDAARIDGAGEFRIFWQIMLPLATPALATLAIFSFQAGWNAFLWPLLITTTDEMRTVQVGLTVFVQQYSTQWDQLMAATVVATLPVIVFWDWSAAAGPRDRVHGAESMTVKTLTRG
jgi:multiple sugar transport system permease protein